MCVAHGAYTCFLHPGREARATLLVFPVPSPLQGRQEGMYVQDGSGTQQHVNRAGLGWCFSASAVRRGGESGEGEGAGAP